MRDVTVSPLLLAAVDGAAPEVPPAPVDDRSWNQLLDEAGEHRVAGWLARAIEDGRISATPAQADQAFDLHERAMRLALVLDHRALEVSERLAAAGIRAVALKGVAAAHADHPDPALRTYQDVDLLVAPGAVDATVHALTASGGLRDLPPRRPDWDRRFAKDIPIVLPTGEEIDLHRTLVPGPFGFAIDLDELHAGVQEIEVGGRTLCVLSPQHRALAAAYALTAGEPEPRLAAALDLRATLAVHAVSTPALVRTAERWRGTILLASAVSWTTAQLGEAAVPPELSAWARSLRAPRAERILWRAYRSAGGTNSSTLLAGPLGMRALGDRVAYLRGLVRPDLPYRRARKATHRPVEWRTAGRELLRRGR